VFSLSCVLLQEHTENHADGPPAGGPPQLTPNPTTSWDANPELKERAVRMVFQLRRETGEKHGSVKRVAEQLDVGVESLRSWVKQAEIDAGERAGTTTDESEELKALRQEVRELKRANQILKSGGCRTKDRRILAVASRRLSSGGPEVSGLGRLVLSGEPPQLEQVVGGADQLPFAVDS
jgi:transposase